MRKGYSWRERGQLVDDWNRPDMVINRKDNDSGYGEDGWAKAERRKWRP